jgi:hypothetical protein
VEDANVADDDALTDEVEIDLNMLGTLILNKVGGEIDSVGDTLTGEVEIDLNILGALILNKVGGEIDSADVVAIDQGGP